MFTVRGVETERVNVEELGYSDKKIHANKMPTLK